MSTNPSSNRAAARCDALIARHALLSHPFYLAWSDGTLPVPALKDYARDYGAFIRTVGQGWEAVGESHIAGVEEGHAQVWDTTFAAGLETAITSAPQTAEVAALTDAARELFAEPETALGALYAFEAQQPFTAQSKLAGLQKHYRQLPDCCGEYFRLHQDDFEEPALLAERIDALPAIGQERALAACERMSRALHNALTGLHAPYAATAC
jgi:pyrroloquinoline-quinone synthase